MYFKNTVLFTTLACCLIGMGCAGQGKFEQQLQALEQRFEAQYSHERSDSLVNLYRAAIKADPDNHARNLRYFTRAAEVQFTKRKDGVSAARWLEDALIHHSKDQNLSELFGLYTRIWNEHQYKTAATIKLDPKDVEAMTQSLRNNQHWIDSALVSLDARMGRGGVINDNLLATRFIEIAEGYSALTSSHDKYADLLLQAAGLAKTINNFNKAIQLYYKLEERLPTHPKANVACFMQGFIYENDLQNLEKAKIAYEDYLRRFPQDTLYADDVRLALKNLGKSPEALIQSFQKGQ